MPDQELQPQPENKPMGLAGKGAILGLIIAYPVSYFFQPSVLRAKLSLGEYITQIGDVLGESNLVSAVIISFVVCPILLAIIGGAIDKSKNS
jgi:hypothetical protein